MIIQNPYLKVLSTFFPQK